MGSEQNRRMNVTDMHDVFCVLCSSTRSLFIWAKIIRYVFDVGSPPPLGIEEGIAAAQTALRPSNCRSLSPLLWLLLLILPSPSSSLTNLCSSSGSSVEL